MKIRGDDPGAMKSFIVSVQNRVNELKASPDDDEKNTNSKRVSCQFIFSRNINSCNCPL